MPEKITLAPVPPIEAIDSLRKKGYAISFDWYDMWQEEHAYNFTVAKATSLDILQDIRQAVDKAIAEGITFEEFRKQLKPVLQEKGWWGKKLVFDPKTGEERLVQLGSSRRLRTIFDTNLRTSYAAGRWEQIQRVKKSRPYLRYLAVMDERTRQQHRQWHNTILPVDDPFWEQHYPPNGWNCRCQVQQLGPRDLKRLGLDVNKTAPTGAPRTFLNKKTGQTVLVPPGLDPAFAYNVGTARLRAMTPPPLERALNIPFTGPPNAVAPPAARAIAKDRLLPDGLSEEEYARRFLKEFKADIGKPVVFTDVAKQPIVISDDLFRNPAGKLKIKKRDRHLYTLLLADAIRDPDEIWHVWEEYPKGKMSLSRVYVTRWLGEDGKTIGGFTMMTVSNAGWTGVTSFKADRSNYLDAVRRGSLVYRREK